MKRVPAGEGIYLSSSEGIDNDGDGRINEDGIGGLDLHRNYPENWRPESEKTGRGYTQGGAGEFPLSETETRAVTDFLLTHPNISVVNSMDTSVPMHLRPPSTSPSDERMYPEDLLWYKTFDEIGRKITGYEKAGDVYNDYGEGNPLFGHGPDFGYWYYGAIWYGDEIWNGARYKDFNNDGDTNQVDMLRWDDEENRGEGFLNGNHLNILFTGILKSADSIQNSFPRILLPAILNPGSKTKQCSTLKWQNICLNLNGVKLK